MQTALLYTWSAPPGFTLYLWWWTNDWGKFHAFSAAPSYNQGFNQGMVAISQVRAYMPVIDPTGPQTPKLAYIITAQNLSGIGVSMYDFFGAWQ